ncbi:hypothetical protein SUDANB19_03565 [Streptomyces sp. enrichment culture]
MARCATSTFRCRRRPSVLITGARARLCISCERFRIDAGKTAHTRRKGRRFPRGDRILDSYVTPRRPLGSHRGRTSSPVARRALCHDRTTAPVEAYPTPSRKRLAAKNQLTSFRRNSAASGHRPPDSSFPGRNRPGRNLAVETRTRNYNGTQPGALRRKSATKPAFPFPFTARFQGSAADAARQGHCPVRAFASAHAGGAQRVADGGRRRAETEQVPPAVRGPPPAPTASARSHPADRGNSRARAAATAVHRAAATSAHLPPSSVWPGRRAAEPPNRRATEPPGRRAPGQRSERTSTSKAGVRGVIGA